VTARRLHYVNDDDHLARGGEGFERALAGVLARLDGATLFVEGICVDADQKARVERAFARHLAGEADLVGPAEMRRKIARGDATAVGPTGDPGPADPSAWADGAWAVVHADGALALPKGRGGSRHALLEALAAHPGAVARVDAGPVHAALDRVAMRLAFGADRKHPSAWSARERAAWRDTLRARDRNWAAYLAAEARDGDAVVMGGHHRLDHLLAAGTTVDGRETPTFDVRTAREGRAVSRSPDPTDVERSPAGRLRALAADVAAALRRRDDR